MDESLPVPPLQFPSSSLPKKVNGYDRAATEEVFNRVASSYEKLWLESSQLRGQTGEWQEEIARLKHEIARYQEEERLLGAAMLDAKRSAAAMKVEAEREAEELLNDAQAQADKIMEDVEPEVQAKVRQILSSAQEERTRLEGEIERLREFSNNTHDELSSFLVAALKWHRSSVDEGPPIPEAEALEDVLDVSSLLNRDAADAELDAGGRAKSKRLSPPRLSPPSS